MATGISFHFGVNRPAGDCCTLNTLRHAETAARHMAAVSVSRGFQSVQMYTGTNATASTVLSSLEQAADRLHAGDLLFVSFSGHGCSVPDDNPPEEIDGRDETWCMSDRMIRDDELGERWRMFREGVRIVVVTESCYAEGSVLLPIGSPMEDMLLPRSTPSDGPASAAVTAAAPPTLPCVTDPPLDEGIKASVLLLAGTPEGAKGEDGLFTAAFMEKWNGGSFDGDYCQLYRAIRARLVGQQLPRVLMKGRPHPSFPRERAFTP